MQKDCPTCKEQTPNLDIKELGRLNKKNWSRQFSTVQFDQQILDLLSSGDSRIIVAFKLISFYITALLNTHIHTSFE